MSCIKVIVLKSFQKAVKKLYTEDEIRKLSEFLSQNPEAGVIIPKTEGLRKLRWAKDNQGKRGGSRIIYYYHTQEGEILLLTAYTKSDQEDLSSDDKKTLCAMIKSIFQK